MTIMVPIVANRLTAILAEQQNALVNTAFSPVVRESLDLACAAFDSTGQMMAQSVGGTPGHINAIATGMAHIAAKFGPTELVPGDVLITNDPWMTAGQINDITVATPVFRRGRLVAWFASCCHSPDIGGRILSASATEIFEEGLRLPIMKLSRAGELNDELIAIIRANVRTPDETVGDLYAQMAGNDVGAASLSRLMDELDLDSLDPVAAQIMDRSERALAEALQATADGTYQSELQTDGFDGHPLRLAVTVTIDGRRILLDFAGSSPQSRHGVNVVLNYTRAYASFAIKAAIAPDVPHNAGSFRPVEVTAPPGSVLNCLPPAPVASRHLVGHFLPSLIFAALTQALPGRLLAHGADALWMCVWRGDPFTLTTFHAGGSGARAMKDGLSATGFPTGVRAAPTEVIEALTPVRQHRRELRTDSGGAGAFRGGLGQTLQVSCGTSTLWSVNANVDRLRFPAAGAAGGQPGATGALTTGAGEALPAKQLVPLEPSDDVLLEMPGGGGFGDPYTRDPRAVLMDVVNGYVSLEAARSAYGVAVSYVGTAGALVRPPSSYLLDLVETARLRAE
ncbi:hydantoinase B/oxoprolinase family protein [Fodinicola feengrottensis]